MSDKQDGGPAFPVIGAPGAPEDYPGMTLRDYFAGQYLAGRMARPVVVTPTNAEYIDDAVIARYAYEIADAMLAKRSKP